MVRLSVGSLQRIYGSRAREPLAAIGYSASNGCIPLSDGVRSLRVECPGGMALRTLRRPCSVSCALLVVSYGIAPPYACSKRMACSGRTMRFAAQVGDPTTYATLWPRQLDNRNARRTGAGRVVQFLLVAQLAFELAFTCRLTTNPLRVLSDTPTTIKRPLYNAERRRLRSK